MMAQNLQLENFDGAAAIARLVAKK